MITAFTMFRRGRLTRSFCAGKSERSLLLLLVLLTLVLQSVSAQQHGSILFHGVIFDASTRQPLPDAHWIIRSRSPGATDSRGMFSFYAHYNDTITFTCIGYRHYTLVVTDTLRAREYTAGIYLPGDTTMIPAVVVIPRLGNIRAEIMAERASPNQDVINATNNLRMAVYQGLANPPELGDPATNYEVLRQKQRMDAYNKGQIASDRMIGLSPLTLIPLIYLAAKGLPEDPEPPAPHISAREMDYLKQVHDSLLIRQ